MATELAEKNEKYEDIITELEATIEKKDLKIAGFKPKIHEYEVRIGQLHAEKGGAEGEKQELRNQIKKLEETIELKEQYNC